MKKYLYIFLILFFCITKNYAQTEKGKRLIGIDLNGSWRSSFKNEVVPGWWIVQSKNSMQGLQTNMRFGYFVLNKFALGLNAEIEFIRTSQKHDTRDSVILSVDKIPVFSFNPFARFYAVRHRNIGIFIEGGAGIAFANSSTRTTNSPLRSTNSILNAPQETFHRSVGENVFNYKLGLGVNYFFTEKAALEFSFFYQQYSFNRLKFTDGLYKENTTMHLGFNYYF